MPLLRNILGALRSAWNARPAAKRTRRHVLTGMDHLDDRQLLTVSFTGNVINDFSSTTGKGVVFLNNPANVIPPSIPPQLQSLVKVSGFQVDGVALSYDPVKDELSVGVLQPDNQRTGQKVIAGDADNNLNSATVSPAVKAVDPNFKDWPDLQADETIGVYFDLNNDGVPDIMAGVRQNPPDTDATKSLVITKAVNTTNVTFGTEIPGYAGNIYLFNDPAHPGFEFSINNFRKLALTNFGVSLTDNSILSAGVYAEDSVDTKIGGGTFLPQAFQFGDIVRMPESCPPVKVNPVYAGVINTLHRGVIRGHVFGTNLFDTRTIDPSSVSLSSPLMAAPVKVFQDKSGQYANFQRRLNGDPFIDRTFLFESNDPAFKTLPYGWTTLIVNGRTTTGETFASQAVVFNVNRGHWDKMIADRIVTAVSESAKHIPPPNYSIPTASAANVLKSARAGIATMPSAANQQLTQATVQIPLRNRAGQGVNVNYGTGAGTAQARQATLAQPVQLGTSTVRIPISNGFGSPVVVNNASQVNTGRRTQTGLNPARTVKINRPATPVTRVRANIAQSINDFLSQ